MLVFLLDDVGFAQLGCFGSDIRTPTFDRLAAGGLRYRDFHTTAICSPTRACLLTGRNHHSNGVGIIQEMATGFPGYNGMVPRENGFLSEMLLAQGYATLGIGKWHLTLASEYASGASKARWPLVARLRALLRLHRRQDQPVGADAGARQPLHRSAAHARRRATTSTPTSPTARSSTSPTCARVAPDKPFFMYYCLGAGHAPHHVEPEWIERYRGKFDQGWDRWREEVFARQLAMGIVPAGHAAVAAAAVGQGVGLAVAPTRGGSTRGRWRCTPRSSSRPTTTSAA